LNNITAGVREREDANRTREAGHLDEIQGVAANTLNLSRKGAVGFIDWLDLGKGRGSRLLAAPRQDAAKRNCQGSESGGSETTEQDKSAVSFPNFVSSGVSHRIAGGEVFGSGIAYPCLRTRYGSDNPQSSD
jgi:hypothetical protein